MNHNEEEALGLLNRLLEQLHQAGYKQIENLVFVAPGAQYVKHIGTQNFGVPNGEVQIRTSQPPDSSTYRSKCGNQCKFDGTDTPLSALFRKNSHEELKRVMETWKPYLAVEITDVLKLNEFKFDLSRIQPSTVYLDLAHLINQGGLLCSMSVLAAYMFSHSNLSKSETTLYSQLRKYKCMCE